MQAQGTKNNLRYSRQKFFEQLRTARRKLKEKINQIDSRNDTYFSYSIPNKQTHSESHTQDQTPKKMNSLQAERMQISRNIMKSQMLEPIYQSAALAYQDKHQTSKQQTKKHQKQKLSSSKHVRLNSLPSKVPNSPQKIKANIKQNFDSLYRSIPKQRSKRGYEQLINILQYLRKHNRLFHKLDQNMSLCLLKIGFFHQLQPGIVFIHTGSDTKSLFFILEGVVSLTNPILGTKRFCTAGDTFGQQKLFQTKISKTLVQTVKSVAKVYILQARINEYQFVLQQTKKNGFAHTVQPLEMHLRNSYTEKNIQRNQQHNRKNRRYYTLH